MAYAVYESKDIGDVFREVFPTKVEAEKRAAALMELEEQRWATIKKKRPDFPRNALSYFTVQEVKT